MGISFTSVLLYGFEIAHYEPPYYDPNFYSVSDDWAVVYHRIKTGQMDLSKPVTGRPYDSAKNTPWSLVRPHGVESVLVCASWNVAFYGPKRVDVTVDPYWEISLPDFCETMKIEIKPPTWLLLGYVS